MPLRPRVISHVQPCDGALPALMVPQAPDVLFRDLYLDLMRIFVLATQPTPKVIFWTPVLVFLSFGVSAGMACSFVVAAFLVWRKFN
jgi:hypothetical protein